MLEDVKRSFLQEQAAKTRAKERAASLEERLRTLEEENASLMLAADNEKSAKDRLLALVHSLIGLLFLPVLKCYRYFSYAETVASRARQILRKFLMLTRQAGHLPLPSKKPRGCARRCRRRRRR